MKGSDSGELRLAAGTITALVVLYLLLSAVQLAGLPWRPLTVVPALLLAAVLAWRLGRRRGAALRWQGLGWGDGVAAAAFLVFLLCTALLWNVHPDFIYHWGIKGARFHLAQGIDFEFLAQPWNGHLHPDYPNLLPSLYALTALLWGSFDEVAMVLWSALFYLLAAVLGRELLRRLEVSSLARQAGVAALALTLTMFGVGYLTAGGADWLLVVAVSAAAVVLAAGPDPRHDLALGMAAALAAASKIEGIALAAILIAAHLARRLRSTGEPPGRRRLRILAETAAPAALVVALWAWQVTSYGLLRSTSAGGFDGGRAAVVFAALWRSLLTVNWHGLSFCLLALPVFLARRRLRPIAAVLGLQLAFYVAVYLTASIDPQEWIRTSAARLFFHLVPTALLLALAAADRWSRPLDGR